jgi:uncharacterized protein YjbI with pentapeptide repeats
MIDCSKLRTDVKRWPVDADARRALEEFFDNMDPAGKFVPILNGGSLDFSGADLSGLELAGAEFSSAHLAGVCMRQSSLYKAWIREADLREVDFSGADLRKAIVAHCTATNAVFTGAALSDVDLSHSNLRGADLHQTSLDDAFMPNVDLRGANLEASHWGTYPYNAVVTDAKLGGANVRAMTGEVRDPVDVGIDEPIVLQGQKLEEWFADNGAPNVVVNGEKP